MIGEHLKREDDRDRRGLALIRAYVSEEAMEYDLGRLRVRMV